VTSQALADPAKIAAIHLLHYLDNVFQLILLRDAPHIMRYRHEQSRRSPV